MAGSTFRTLAKSHNAASVAAGDDILAAVVAPRNGVLVIGLAVDTATTVQLGVLDEVGGTTEKFDLNEGVALLAGKAYAWTWPAQSGYLYSLVNKSGATATTIMTSILQIEVPVG